MGDANGSVITPAIRLTLVCASITKYTNGLDTIKSRSTYLRWISYTEKKNYIHIDYFVGDLF